VSAQTLDRPTRPTSTRTIPARRPLLRDLLVGTVQAVGAARVLHSTTGEQARRDVVQRFARDLPR